MEGEAKDTLLYSRLDPDSSFRAMVHQKIRPDGRGLARCRKLSVIRGILQKNTQGSALVKLGGTKVVAGISLQVGQPAEDTPACGELSVEVHLSPLCSPRYSSVQAQMDEGKTLESLIQAILLRNQVFRKQDLCIAEGRHVWKVCLDIMCLSHEGSLLDAALLAAIAALANLKLPPTEITKEDEVIIVRGPPKAPELQRLPVALTIGVYGEATLLADLTHAEEDRISNRVTVVMDTEGMICCLHKPGGGCLTGEVLEECLKMAAERVSLVKDLLFKQTSG